MWDSAAEADRWYRTAEGRIRHRGRGADPPVCFGASVVDGLRRVSGIRRETRVLASDLGQEESTCE